MPVHHDGHCRHGHLHDHPDRKHLRLGDVHLASMSMWTIVPYLQNSSNLPVTRSSKRTPNASRPDAPGAPDYDRIASLILVADHGVGIGGGASETTAAVPHLEALLAQLPLGLAMADRDGRLLFANPDRKSVV